MRSVSVVIPCLNEAENIEACVKAALAGIAAAGLPGEVLVVDNGSSDGSGEIAAAAGARVVREERRGYGRAYLTGLEEATGDALVMADADLTYDFGEVPRFVATLNDGAEMVIGNRMNNIQPGAMPWLHRYVGNPLLTGILNLFFRTGVRDAHCGMRAVRKEVLPRLALRTTGMEFASEMVIRGAKERLDIRQFDIDYHPRGGESKLSTFSDGWRHLKFLLVHSPTHLFIIPGSALLVLGLLVMGLSLGDVSVFGRQLQIHALIGGSVLALSGTQIVAMGVCAATYAHYFLGDRPRWIDEARRRWRLENGLLAGLAILAIGAAMLAFILVSWIGDGFGDLGYQDLAVVGATLVAIGLQIVFCAFLVSILGMRRPAS